VINLSGQSEIEISDGTKRRFGPGDIFLVDDTKGRGHISRAVGSQPRLLCDNPREIAGIESTVVVLFIARKWVR
jgi:hypothetical protein